MNYHRSGINFIFLAVLYLIGYDASAFPQNIRFGYSSCQSCHVSPSGGGVLTSYGRMSAEEILSTWSYENESSPTHGAYEYVTDQSDNPSRVMVGADIRAVQIKTKDRLQFIKMQKEFELALALDDRLTVVGTVGEYAAGETFIKEYRRHYVLYNFSDNVSVRAGKFQPAYGLNLDDHTLGVRSGLGFDQDATSHNLEIDLKNKLGEITITPGVSKTTEVSETGEGRYRLQTEEKTVNLRLALNVGEKNQVGISAQIKQDDRLGDRGETKKQFGVFGVYSLTKNLYVMKDNNWRVLNNTGPIKWHPYFFDLVGLELFKGFHVQLYYERKNQDNEYGTRVQWFPRPHWDLSATYEKTSLGDVGIFLFHYYL